MLFFSFNNTKENQGKPAEEHNVLHTNKMQSHNEFMVAECEKKVYAEYLLLFKFANNETCRDLKDYLYDHCIYKAPNEYEHYPEIYLKYLNSNTN